MLKITIAICALTICGLMNLQADEGAPLPRKSIEMNYGEYDSNSSSSPLVCVDENQQNILSTEEIFAACKGKCKKKHIV